MQIQDFHTHNLDAEPGTAIINLPISALLHPETFHFREGALYSVGIHPWWTSEDTDTINKLWEIVTHIARNPQVVAIGECGLDRLQGGDMKRQSEIFLRHILLSEELKKPLTIHCVRAFDLLLGAKKEFHPEMKWTVHAFRGRPALARQLLHAGFDLSFGAKHNHESFRLTPPERRHVETDDSSEPLPTPPTV
ncbi:MAG: TatD family hydrolase [Alloprevotella sp.]|nr:TatD family hydrolase [Alloprevotella sp.]